VIARNHSLISAVADVFMCVSVAQSSPPMVLESGDYHISVGANCPTAAAEFHLAPLHVELASRKAYFVLVSGWPPQSLRAKLVSSTFTHRCSSPVYLSQQMFSKSSSSRWDLTWHKSNTGVHCVSK